jgi:hypothetical protein
MPSVVTANELRSGAVVYLTRAGEWVANLADASAAASPDELKQLEALALAAVERNEITSVYAFDVALVGGKPTATSVRERIRAMRAPSV